MTANKVTRRPIARPKAKISARQQCVYEGHSEEIYGKSTQIT